MGSVASTKFVISAERCPQTLSRLLGLFAQQDRLISRAEINASRRRLRIVLQVLDIDDHRAEIIAEKMRAMISVRFVRYWISRGDTL